MSSTVPIETSPIAKFQITAPDGRRIVIDEALFDAMDDMVRRKCTGSVIAEFRSGGISQVRSEQRKVFK